MSGIAKMRDIRHAKEKRQKKEGKGELEKYVPSVDISFRESREEEEV